MWLMRYLSNKLAKICKTIINFNVYCHFVLYADLLTINLFVIQDLSYYVKHLTTNIYEYSFYFHFVFTCYSFCYFVCCHLFLFCFDLFLNMLIRAYNVTKNRITRSFILLFFSLNNTLFTKNNISLETHPVSSR